MECCRTCLGTESLCPIFMDPARSQEYSDILFTCTGLEVLQHDSLPQKMCVDCVGSINKHMAFRRTCHEAQESLVNSFEKQCDAKSDVTNDNDIIASESSNDNDGIKRNDSYIEFTMTVKDVLNKRTNIIFNNLKNYGKRELNYAEVEELSRVKKTEVARKCKLCHKVFETKIALNSHHKIHLELNVVCEHCGKKFINKRRLLMHCKAKHGYEKTDKCSYCDYRGCNAELVKIHERLHTGERPYMCGECGVCFHRRSSFLQHIPIHLPEKTVQCDECPAMFKSVTLMRIHKYKHKKRIRARHTTMREGEPLDKG